MLKIRIKFKISTGRIIWTELIPKLWELIFQNDKSLHQWHKRKKKDKCWVPLLHLFSECHTSSPCEASVNWATFKLVSLGHTVDVCGRERIQICDLWPQGWPYFLSTTVISLRGNPPTASKHGERVWHPRFSKRAHRKCLPCSFKICITTHQLLGSAAPDVFPAKIHYK